MTSIKTGQGQSIDYGKIVASVDRVFQRRYRVYRTSIGEGGMGTVFRVETNDSFRMKRALKILYKRNQRPGMNIYAEVNAVKGMDHPGIPQVIEVGEDNEAVYIIQELVEGQSLRQIIERNGSVSDETLILWMGDVADALSYLHQRNIIHRDIKPTNIMVTAEGRIKLIDFGLAKEMEEVDTADNRIIGTKNYTPPERYEGLPADVRTDIYEFGTTFYNLATGQLPLEMSSDSRRHMVTMRRNLDNVKSPGIRSILKKCIDVNPDRRYQSFDEIRYRIKTIDEFNKSIAANEKRHKVLKGATAAVLALAVVILGAGIWRSVVDHDKHYDSLIADAKTLEDEGKYEKAIKKAEKAISFNSGRTQGYLRKYQIMTSQAEASDRTYKEVRTEIINGINQNEELEQVGTILFLKGNAEYELNKSDDPEGKEADKTLDEAINRFNEEEKVDEESIRDARVIKALYYIDEKQFDNAKREVAKIKKESPETKYIDGYSNENQGYYSKAEKNYKDVLEKEKKNDDLRRKAGKQLAMMYTQKMQKPAEAVKLIMFLQKDNKYMRNNLELSLILADAYMDLKQYDKVLGVYDRIQKEQDYNSYQIMCNSCGCYLMLKQPKSAIGVAEKMIETDKNRYEGYVFKTRAICLENEKMLERMFDENSEYQKTYRIAKEKAIQNGKTNEDAYIKMEEQHNNVERLKTNRDAQRQLPQMNNGGTPQ